MCRTAHPAGQRVHSAGRQWTIYASAQPGKATARPCPALPHAAVHSPMSIDLDVARIHVKAGDGGNGVVSFRREKFVPFGGPDGGDGGRGGSVYLVAKTGVSTLIGFARQHHFKAQNGGHGRGARQHGKAGEDLTIPVPPGTQVRSDDGLEIDLLRPGDTAMVARGGRGGLGNTHFATSTQRAPRIAQNGEPGEERWLDLELKTIAQAALIGEPNAGKSSLLAATSGAHPRIGDYPFTTLTPNLGVVDVAEDQDVFVLADVPGLIAGAHTGAGLGHRFLRHVERAPILVHVVDASRPDVLDAYWTVRAELEAYKQEVAAKPEIIAANKHDLPGAREGVERLREALPDRQVIGTSTVTNEGVPALLDAVAQLLAQQPKPPEPEADHVRVYRFTPKPDDGFNVELEEPGVYRVRGRRVERLVAMTDLDSEQGTDHLQRQLERLGVFEALERAGVQVGDTVRIGEWETEWSV
jgi:GTPase